MLTELTPTAEAARLYLGIHEDEATQADFNHSSALSLENQLQFNSLIMEVMGLHAPDGTALTAEQSSRLEQTYGNALDETRLFIAPLFPSDSSLLTNRQNMLWHIRDNVPNADLKANQDPLQTPSYIYDYSKLGNPYHHGPLPRSITAYGQLLQNPDDISYADRKVNVRTGLRYLSPLTKNTTSNVVDRSTYLDQLDDQGLVVPGAEGTLWTYNFANISPITPRSPSKNVRTLFENLSSPDKTTNSPEHAIAIRALHIIAEASNTDRDANVTNEAVYSLGKSNNPEALRTAAVVGWDPHSKQVFLVDWRARERANFLSDQEAVSGL